MRRMTSYALGVLSAGLLGLACNSSSSTSPDGGTTPDSSSADRGVSADAAPSSCAAGTAAPVEHTGYLKSSETWGSDTPHLVKGDLTVPKDMTLTISPCADVRLKKSARFIVLGTLVARGEAAKRIRFRRDNPSERYSSLWIRDPGKADLAYADLEGGGDLPGQTYGATIQVEGGAWPPSKPLRVEHVTVSHSAGYGIWMTKWAGFADGSTDLTVTASGETATEYPFALRMTLNTVGTLPDGKYTGNATDEIQVIGESPYYESRLDDTFHNRGVPYQIGGNGAFGLINVVGAGALSTLTIEAGVTIKFFGSPSNIGGLFIGNTGVAGTGKIVAVGTASAPITFTAPGKSPAPGAWEGVSFLGTVVPGNRLEYVKIEAAGAHGGDSGFGCPPTGSTFATDGALKIFAQPSEAFLKNSTISNSSSHGVFRAWNGLEVDFLPTNTFQNIAGCTQILPKDDKRLCPKDPPCPK